jgi:hypothetical protein
LQANKLHPLLYSASGDALFSENADSGAFFRSVAHAFDKHTEDDFIDFYYERNLPVMLSQEGPHIAKGDVNGDGREDLYIGGAKDQPGQLYLQTADGSL